MEGEQRDWLDRPATRNVSRTGTACLGDGTTLHVLVSDLSYRGCKLLCGKRLKVGDPVTLTVPGLGSLDAQAKWTAGDKAGISFLHGNPTSEEVSR